MAEPLSSSPAAQRHQPPRGSSCGQGAAAAAGRLPSLPLSPGSPGQLPPFPERSRFPARAQTLRHREVPSWGDAGAGTVTFGDVGPRASQSCAGGSVLCVIRGDRRQSGARPRSGVPRTPGPPRPTTPAPQGQGAGGPQPTLHRTFPPVAPPPPPLGDQVHARPTGAGPMGPGPISIQPGPARLGPAALRGPGGAAAGRQRPAGGRAEPRMEP